MTHFGPVQRHYYRRWPTESPMLDLEVPAGIPKIGGSKHTIPPGAWVRSDLLIGQSTLIRSQFGGPVKGTHLPMPNARDADGLLVILPEVRDFESLPSRLKGPAVAVRSTTIPPEVAVLHHDQQAAELAADLAHVPCLPVAVPQGTQLADLVQSLPAQVGFVAVVPPRWDPSVGWLADLGEAALEAPCLGDFNPSAAWPSSPALYRVPEVRQSTRKIWVIVTTFGRADVVTQCMRALHERTRYQSWGMVWVDDASPESERLAIERAVGSPPLGVRRVRLAKNGGYLKAANLGAKVALQAGADAVVMLNSDVVVTPGWLQAMDQAIDATGAGLVNPGCNDSAMISMPLAGQKRTPFPRLRPGVSYLDIAGCLRLMRPRYPAAVTSVGQCLLITREVWEKHGPFDEAYGRGYGEECALWAKLLAAGGKAVVADNSFVWHESHATHGTAARDDEKAGVDRFVAAHSEVYNAHKGDMARWPEKTAHARSLVWASSPVSLPVQFFAVDLGPWGGAYVLLRLVHELRELGISAQLGHLKTREHSYTPTYGTLMHRHEEGLAGDFCRSSGWAKGILVASHWSTGRLIKAIAEANPGVIPAAFWQDIESRFINPSTGQRAITPREYADYVAIPDRVVNSMWVGEEGRKEHKYAGGFSYIPVGIDCRLFMPRPERASSRRTTVLAMWRPQTKRRGHQRLQQTLADLRRRFGDSIEIQLYGWKDAHPRHMVDKHWGQITQREVADALSGADVFLEPSDYHGFGLPGAEAMASGCALVSTACKGVDAYATHLVDAMVVPHDQFAAAAAKVIEDKDLRARLAAAGPPSIARIDWPIIGAKWALWLTKLWRERGQGDEYRRSIAAVDERAHRVLRETT